VLQNTAESRNIAYICTLPSLITVCMTNDYYGANIDI